MSTEIDVRPSREDPFCERDPIRVEPSSRMNSRRNADVARSVYWRPECSTMSKRRSELGFVARATTPAVDSRTNAPLITPSRRAVYVTP